VTKEEKILLEQCEEIQQFLEEHKDLPAELVVFKWIELYAQRYRETASDGR